MNNNQTHEMTQEAVKARFHGHKTLRGKTTPLLPDGAEREMKRLTNALMKIANEELKKRLPEIMREYARAERGDSRTDGIGDLDKYLRRIFQEIAIAISNRIDSLHIETRMEQISKMAKNFAIREWKRAVRNTLGIDILTDYYKGSLYTTWIQKWIDDNVSKIKTIPSNTLGGMRSAIMDGYLNGRSLREIQKEIQSQYSVDKHRAQMLARDQIGSLNSQITQAQQRDAGVTHYKWSTSKDARVRDCHAELDGKIISWDDPPEMWYETKKDGRVYTGRRCHPGEDYCCRCVPIPVFDYDKIDLPVQATEKKR